MPPDDLPDPQDDPNLSTDPVDTEIDPEDDEDVTDPAGEPDEPDAGDQDPQDAAPPPAPSRREDRIRTLAEENRRKDAELAETRRRLDELTTRVINPPPAQETPEQRNARLSLMAPEDRLREEYREDQTRHRREMQQMAFQLQDQSDRAAYQARCAVHATYRKYENQVETKLAEFRSKGQNAPRLEVLKWLIGDRMLQQLDSPKAKKQVEAAQRRVDNARQQPVNTRSDVQATRTRAGDSAEKRLENVLI